MSKIVASIVTFNRKQAVVDCLRAVASQTVPVDEALVIDNGSTDGTEQAIVESGVAERLPILSFRLDRNAGAAGGYHVAFREALNRSPDWVWVMSDDVVADPDALERMLSSGPAQDERTAAICPAVVGPGGHLQPEYTGGAYRFGQRIPVSESEHEKEAVQIEHSSFMGMLVRASAAADAGPPMAEFFLSGDDLEWFLRLRGRWSVWLVPSARLVHQDDVPASGMGILGAMRRAFRPVPDSEIWKVAYAFRNMSWIGVRYDDESRFRFGLSLLKQWTRILLADPHRLRRMRLLLDYGLAGRRGEFRNCPPEVFAEHAREKRGSRRLAAVSAPVQAGDLVPAGPPQRL